MLAGRTLADLSRSEIREGLTAVRDDLVAGRLRINMVSIAESDLECGTVACIGGHLVLRLGGTTRDVYRDLTQISGARWDKGRYDPHDLYSLFFDFPCDPSSRSQRRRDVGKCSSPHSEADREWAIRRIGEWLEAHP